MTCVPHPVCPGCSSDQENKTERTPLAEVWQAAMTAQYNTLLWCLSCCINVSCPVQHATVMLYQSELPSATRYCDVCHAVSICFIAVCCDCYMHCLQPKSCLVWQNSACLWHDLHYGGHAVHATAYGICLLDSNALESGNVAWKSVSNLKGWLICCLLPGLSSAPPVEMAGTSKCLLSPWYYANCFDMDGHRSWLHSCLRSSAML